MANRDIFSKHLPSVKLATRLDAEGHEVQVERREDVDATQKEQETFDMLVAAGYYRAKIKGLSAFDKVVGGMTWCIECCDYDVDVDLLFHENLTIGQKITLVEKIVSVLPQMKCPYAIEPHQIQGLEFLSIHPVIQWLVKTSVENRKERSQRLKKFAVSQFHNNYQYKTDKELLSKIRKASANIKQIQELYAPDRVYQLKTSTPASKDERTRTTLTLAEYGWKLLSKKTAKNEGDCINNELDVEKLFEKLHLVEKPNITQKKKKFEAQKRNELNQHYAEIKLEMECGAKALIEQNEMRVLEATKSSLAAKVQVAEKENELLKEKLEKDEATFSLLQQKEQELKAEIAAFEDMENKSDKELLSKVQNLLKKQYDLKNEEAAFKCHCREDLTHLEKQIEELKAFNVLKPEVYEAELAMEKDTIQELKLQIAKKNRGILAIQRQLDAIPDPIELAQYQQRFLELYNEMSAKHLETKQYFALYNALNDQKTYIDKELSLLNSICDTYNETIKNAQGREEFVQQMEKVAEGVRQTEAKMAQKYNDECQRRDVLNNELQVLHELQRHYVAAVRKLTKEFQRCEQLQQHLRSIRANTSI